MFANLANLAIAPLLHLPADTRGLGARAAGTVAAHRTAAQILLDRAPALSSLQHGATLSRAEREHILGDLQKLSRDDHRVAAHRAIDHVISTGNASGLWAIPSIGVIAQHALAPSLFGTDDAKTMQLVGRWRFGIIEGLPSLLESKDPLLLSGLLIVSAVIFDAVLIADFLHQLPTLASPILVGRDHAWVKFTYRANPDKNAAGKNLRCRRWVLSTIAMKALRRLQDLPAGDRDGVSTAQALAAVENALKISLPSRIEALVKASTVWWSLRLSAAHIHLATTAKAVESLPDPSMERLVRNVRLPGTRAPVSSRKIRRAEAAWRRARARLEVGPPSVDQSKQLAAYRGLVRVLNKPPQAPVLTQAVLRERLLAWKGVHGELGGWVEILAAWVEEVLFELREAGNGKNLRPSSVRRYLASFAPWLLLLAGDLDPRTTTSWQLLGRLEVLRTLNTQRRSEGLMHHALLEFLLFAERRCSVPPVYLHDAWGKPPKNGCPDANLITPAEYESVLADFDRQFASAPWSYPHRRLRVITILGFRAGLRWMEVATMALGQVRLFETSGKPNASLLVVANPFAETKTASGERRLELANLLTEDELAEVIHFLRCALDGFLGTTALSALLFADAHTPDLPPKAEETHDVIQQAMRRVSGDSSLVFHHLRHSAATYIQWRLFMQRDCPLGNLSFFRDVQASKFACGDGNYGELLTGRANSVSWHYGVSETLGQIDPAVSYQSYTHLSEMGLQSATWDLFMQLSIPTDSQRALRGNKSNAAIYKARFRRRRALTPAPHDTRAE